MKAYTDYPILKLGDIEGKKAPIRECQLIDYDDDKYITVIVEGVTEQIKSGYIYKEPVRYSSSAPRLSRKELQSLIKR